MGAALADDLVGERLAHEHGEQLAGLHGREIGHGPATIRRRRGFAAPRSGRAARQRLEAPPAPPLRDLRRVGSEGAGRGVGQPRSADGVEVALGGLEVGVAEHVAHGDWVEDAREERAGGVAEVMEAQRREACSVACGDEAATERRGVGAVAGDGREDVVVGAREVRAAREAVEGAERLVAERDVADAAALGCALDVAGERALDDEDALGPADVAPAQGDELAAAEAGVGSDAEQLGELGVLLGAEQGAGGRRVLVRAAPGARLRRSSEGLDLLDGEDLDAPAALLAASRRRRPDWRSGPSAPPARVADRS